MTKEKRIYDLGLHEEIALSNSIFVLRVPGGWIYQITFCEHITSTFVPEIFREEIDGGYFKEVHLK